MRQTLLLILAVVGLSAPAFGQAAPSDSQTLQSLLTEVRELRQELRISLTRMQSAEIVLSRLQTQQSVVVRASERLEDAHAKLAATQDNQKRIVLDINRLEDALGGDDNLPQQKVLQEEINHLKSERELSAEMELQSQTAEIECEQQLRSEQDKLNALENQLDEITKNLGNPGEQPGGVLH